MHVADFANAILAFGATFDDAEADHARKIADEAGVPLNLADRPQMSDFIMGAIVNRSPLVIGGFYRRRIACFCSSCSRSD